MINIDQLPPGFRNMVNLIKKDWDGADPWERLIATSRDQIPHMSQEENARWLQHIHDVAAAELPNLRTADPQTAWYLRQVLRFCPKPKE